MTYAEVKYELNQMTTEEIHNWFFKNYGESIIANYGELPRKELVHQLATDNAQ